MAIETTTNLSANTISSLKELITLNIDSRDGFKYAAEKIDNLSVASMFQRLADERCQQATELRKLVEYNDENVDRSGSFAASLHRTWMGIREAFSGSNLHSVLAEAERGEDHIKAAYESALKETVGSPVHQTLTEQYAAVKAAHDSIRDMRDAQAEE